LSAGRRGHARLRVFRQPAGHRAGPAELRPRLPVRAAAGAEAGVQPGVGPDPGGAGPGERGPARDRAGGEVLMRALAILGFAALAASAPAGTLTGTVAARGPAGAQAAASDGAYASHRYRLAERVDYDHLADFVVSIDQAVDDPSAPPPPDLTVTQRNVSFEPHVLPIVVGTTVRWPNKDTIFHNVFSMSDAKPFDLGMYTKEKVPELKFDQVGRVDVYCSIHSQMHCII